MGKFYSLWFIILLCSKSFGQWFWQNPIPQGNILSSVKCISPNTVIAIGDYGTILKSNTFFNNWEFKISGTVNFLQKLHFINDQIGYIFGSKGIILKTTNAGSSWFKLNINNNSDLISGFFLDENIGFCCSYEGKIFKTSNGGNDWINLNINNTRSLFSIYFLSPLKGFAVGMYGTLLKTTDGGETWIKKDSVTTQALKKIIFVNDSTGFMLGGNLIFKTVDGGNTWSFKQMGYSEILYDLTIISKNKAILVGNNIYRSDDLNTWIQKTNFGYYYNTGFKSVSFIDSLHGIAVGSDGIVYETTNAGDIWIPKNKSILTQNDNYIYFDFVNKNDGITFTYLGNIYKTSNGGANWFLKLKYNWWSSNADFLNNEIGFVVGYGSNSGIIFKTTNSGDTWGNNFNYPSTKFTCIDFFNDSVGIIIGQPNLVLRTTNCGLTWNQILNNYNSPWKKVYFIRNSSVGFIFSDALLLRTSDFGNTWNQITVSVDNILDISFYNNEGLATNAEGFIIKSTNTGETWSQYFNPLPTYKNPYFVKVVDQGNYFIASNDGFILNTIKGGLLNNKNDTYKSVINFTNFILYQNYPNPFNPKTKIKFQIANKGFVSLKVFDILGNELEKIVNEEKDTGVYETEFNGVKYSSGIYFYQLKIGNYMETKKFLLLK